MFRQTPVQHIRQKLQEAEFFLGGVRHFANAIDQMAAAGQGVFTTGYPLVRRLQYNLSAMLSAYQCTLNYMDHECTTQAGQQWYRKVARRQLIKAFGALRNSDVHDETIATTHRTTIVLRVSRRSDMMLDAEALRATKNLGARPKVIQTLTSRPIVDLATEAYRELAQAVDDGYTSRRFDSLPQIPKPTKPIELSEEPPRTLDDYLSSGAMNDVAHKALRDAVAQRRIVQISGDPRSGKTSLLHAVLREYRAAGGGEWRATLLRSDSAELDSADSGGDLAELTVVVGERANGHYKELDAIFVDDGDDQSFGEALSLWQAGAAGAFTMPSGDITPRRQQLNAVAPVSVVMTKGAVGMLIARHDNVVQGDADDEGDV